MTCWEILGIPPDSSPEKIKLTYRALVFKCHPDVGGDRAEFIKLSLAYQAALAEATQPVLCSECSGLGVVPRISGWAVINEHCFKCKGSGQVERK